MNPGGVVRKLAAILYADVAEYSRLTGEDEEGTHRILSAYLDAVTAMIERHNGRAVHFAGDAVLAEFPSVVVALTCAVAIQGELAARNARLPENRRLRFRIGINLGDVIVDRGDIYGDDVNVAARLESLADPGGICISGTVYDEVERKLDYHYEYLGEQQVKNIDRPVRAYRVAVEGDGAHTAPPPAAAPRRTWRRFAAGAALVAFAAAGFAAWTFLGGAPSGLHRATRAALAVPDKPSIAVLPFTNMSGDPEQEYFSDGMTEDLITDLSQVSGLFVIARNSVFTYKGRPVDVARVAAELGVRYVLEGSVRKADGRVRINAQLIDAATGGHIWAERFDREVEDVFALQDEVTAKIVSALKVRLTDRERRSLAGTYTDSIEAYDLFLRGFELVWRFAKAENRMARDYFEQAIALDPGFARAYANLARTYTNDLLLGWGDRPEILIERAVVAARRAVELDSSLPLVHHMLGYVSLFGKRDHKGAIAHLERSIAIEPNYADSYALLAQVLQYAGRPIEALGVMRKAMRLNPHYPWGYLWALGEIQFSLERYDDAIATLEEGLQRNPDAQWLRLSLAASYVRAGRMEEGRWQVNEILVADPDFSLRRIRAVVPYKDPTVRDRLFNALRVAGAPR